MAGGGSDEDNPIPLNVTPMIDIIFCLIIFFMCSFHFKQLEGKIDSWLPKDKGVHGNPVTNPVLEEMRVIMSLDKDNNTLLRKLGARPLDDSDPTKDTDGMTAGDRSLGDFLVSMNDDFKKLGKNDIPVIIDAEPHVPWKEVITVMNVCKHYKLEKIEFAAPMPGR